MPCMTRATSLAILVRSIVPIRDVRRWVMLIVIPCLMPYPRRPMRVFVGGKRELITEVLATMCKIGARGVMCLAKGFDDLP